MEQERINRVLSIQSHVVHGYVGNKSATLPLQLLGLEVDPLNTVQFSNHVGYPTFKGISFDEIVINDLFQGLFDNNFILNKDYTHCLVGYCGKLNTLQAIANNLEKMKIQDPSIQILVDPVLGDNGRMYCPPEMIPVYQTNLFKLADIITPNGFEAEILTGIKPCFANIHSVLDALHKFGPRTVIITSVQDEGKISLYGSSGDVRFKIDINSISGHFTGTGDAFAALLLGLLNKYEARKACEIAVDIMQSILINTSKLRLRGNELALVQSIRDILEPKPFHKSFLLKVGNDFLFKLRYNVDLPAVPFDPVLLEYPHPKDRLYKFNSKNSLSTNQKYELLHPDGDQGLGCNPFELGFFERAIANPNEKLKPRTDLDPKDTALLAKPSEKQSESKAAPLVPWLRRTEYISAHRNVFGRGHKETKKQNYELDDLEMSEDSKIRRIEATFEYANKNLTDIKHPKNPELKAMEIFPIIPDFENWSDLYCLSAYDESPLTSKNMDEEGLLIQLEDALLKPLQVENEIQSEKWMTFYAPSKDAISKIKEKRKLEEIEQYDINVNEYEYVFKRDFDYETKDPTYSYFLELREDEGGAFYNPIQTMIKMKKRRAMSKQDAYYEDANKPSKVIMKHREISQQEKEHKKAAMQKLLQQEVEEEEDDF